MKRIETSLVRISILLTSLYVILSIILAWNGISISHLRYIFGHSLLYDTLLLVLCLNNKRYHCKYMLSLCINSIITCIISSIDIYFYTFTANAFLFILSASSMLSLAITILLAIRHFILKRIAKSIEYKLK